MSMEVDMSAPMDTFRVSRTKRARSPASPRASERPSKRLSMGGNACLSIPALAPQSRHGSEDWVVQTRGLSIESPLVAQGLQLEEVRGVAAGAGAEREGEQMVDTTMLDEDVAMSCSPPRPRLGIDAHSEPTLPPAVQGLPSTSASTTDVPMATSQSQDHTAPPARKQRFTMGPRADCEKCRLGVKGHWMHFD
ncbi:uncharacterized protein C8Q71DRAFT_732706 [Rhodofomes roseus]|uniref:Uncharacterized protein n=1 Tax=Rhodofomes roseus TaxID=34475 RepID=A0ABQ8KUB0_9APHY|nr:uncharacterized protein C8Q71DRAFT_732706 [Rhodofomes roseus]KAH9842401.1 hypothetical protein C8Q71DRAFT_732706 [Rhodofomes roseus]